MSHVPVYIQVPTTKILLLLLWFFVSVVEVYRQDLSENLAFHCVIILNHLTTIITSLDFSIAFSCLTYVQ